MENAARIISYMIKKWSEISKTGVKAEFTFRVDHSLFLREK